MAYSDQLIDHFENPKNVGSFDKGDTHVGVGLVGAPACGDVLKLSIKVDPTTGVIEDARFKTYGCLTSNALINTPTKSKKISELVVGDEVLAWDGTTVHPQKIKNILTHSVDIDDLLKITFQRTSSRNNINAGQFSLICTKDHIFWNADNKPIEAQTIVPGQELYEITEHELRILTNNRHRPEIKEKNSKRMKEFNKTFDKSVLPQNNKGYKCKDPEEKSRRTSIASKANWNNLLYVAKWRASMSAIDRLAPTSIEKQFIKLFEEHNIGAKWSAGKVWIHTTSGPASPDFIIPGKKKCIEVYTKKLPKFMQDRSDDSDYITNRKIQLASAGYDTLFLAIEDIDYALPQVQNFIHNGIKVVSVEKITHRNELRGCKKDGNKIIVYDLKLEEGSHVFFANRVGSHNCGSAIASSSLVTEWVKGKTLDEAATIRNTAIAEELALPPVKIHCSILAESAITEAIRDYKNKNNIK